MVEESPEMIKSQMEQTRNSLAEKIETLEQQVSQTVQEATSAVTNTVDTVKEVVNNTTEAVQSTVDSVKQTLDLSGHVQRSPWLMFGGAVMTGFVLGKLLPPPVPSTSPHHGREPKEKQPEQQTQSSTLSALGSLFEKPLEIAEGLAVGTFFSLARDVLQKALPDEWKSELLGVVDNLNRQLGGRPLTGLTGNGESTKDKGDRDHAERNGPKVAGAVGAADGQGEEGLGPVHRRRIDGSGG